MSSLFKRTLPFFFLFCSTFAPLFAQSDSEPKYTRLPNGDYMPGIVLAYQSSGNLTVAEPSKVNRSEHNYVIVHGAHNTSKHAIKVAKALFEQEPNSNIFIVDWGYCAKINSDKIGDIIKAQLLEFSLETFGINVIDALAGYTEEEITEDQIQLLTDNIQELIRKILLNWLPIEQSLFIPSIANRSAEVLFGEEGTPCNLVIDETEITVLALGLDPQNTMLIGHSHGAHLAGMIAKNCQQRYSKNVKYFWALEPSPELTHIAEENKEGTGWDNTVADNVLVLRTSRRLCAERCYGGINLCVAPKEHPLDRLPSEKFSSEIEQLETLINGLEYDAHLHRTVLDVAIGLINEGCDKIWGARYTGGEGYWKYL